LQSKKARRETMPSLNFDPNPISSCGFAGCWDEDQGSWPRPFAAFDYPLGLCQHFKNVSLFLLALENEFPPSDGCPPDATAVSPVVHCFGGQREQVATQFQDRSSRKDHRPLDYVSATPGCFPASRNG